MHNTSHGLAASSRARLYAGVAELVDARDLNSRDGDIVPVRVRPPAPEGNPK